jgi:preprotein translocase subunit YajC
MRIIIIAMVLLISFTSCRENNKKKELKKEDIAYLSFGKKITAENSISKEIMAKKFENLKKGDTIAIKFSSNINEVCKEKGCWMKLDLGNERESMVKFTDYGFFMPLNSDKRDVIVEGRAFISEISIEELQHFAKDAGKSEEEISNITEPEMSYGFEADGVLMKE